MDVIYGQMMMIEFVLIVTALVNVVMKEHSTINVLLAQTDHISMMEFVEIAQMPTGQMKTQILVTNAIPHVNYVMDPVNMTVPNVMFPMDSIFKMMDNVSDLAQILIILM